MLHVFFCVRAKTLPMVEERESERNSYVVSFSTIKYHDVGFQCVFLVGICIELSVEFSFIFRVKIENTKHAYTRTHPLPHHTPPSCMCDIQ